MWNLNPFHNRITVHMRYCHCWKDFINEQTYSEHKGLKFLLCSLDSWDWRYYRSAKPETIEIMTSQINQTQNYWKKKGFMRKKRFQIWSCSKCGTYKIVCKVIELLDGLENLN